MRPRMLAVLVLFVLGVFAPRVARAQCDGWLAMPFGQGASPTGANNPISAITLWDPDQGGPRPTMLVVGGQFTSIQGVAAGAGSGAKAMRPPRSSAAAVTPASKPATIARRGHMVGAEGTSTRVPWASRDDRR